MGKPLGQTLSCTSHSPLRSLDGEDQHDPVLQPIWLLRPLQRSPVAPSPSASLRRDLDLSLRVPGSKLGSYGARIRLSVGVVVRCDAHSRLSLDPPRCKRAPPPRCCVVASPRPRTAGLPLEKEHSLAYLMDIKKVICLKSPRHIWSAT